MRSCGAGARHVKGAGTNTGNLKNSPFCASYSTRKSHVGLFFSIRLPIHEKHLPWGACNLWIGPLVSCGIVLNLMFDTIRQGQAVLGRGSSCPCPQRHPAHRAAGSPAPSALHSGKCGKNRRKKANATPNPPQVLNRNQIFWWYVFHHRFSFHMWDFRWPDGNSRLLFRPGHIVCILKSSFFKRK